MSKDKFLLVKGTSGLGDRIQCVLTSILYAQLTGRRLLVDWRDPYYSGDGTNVFPHFFQCSLCNPNDEVPATDSVAPPIWRGHLHESAPAMRQQYGNVNDRQVWQKFSIDLTRIDYQEDIVVLWTYTEQVNLLRRHFHGPFKEFAQASSDAILRQLLREELFLHPQLRSRVEQFKNKYFGQKTVGVHVRYTDHRTRLWAILKRLNTLLKQEPDLQIFLATDNRQIKAMFEESYPGVLTTPHWYASTPGLPLHTGQNRLDPIESGRAALIDSYLLAECDYLLIDTSSSFSYVATLLTKAPDSCIFNVRRRGKPPSWRRRVIYRLMLRTGLFSWGLGILRKCVRIKSPTRGY